MHQNPPSIWPDFLAGQLEKPVRVLLVDDDAHMRRVIAQELMSDQRTLLVAQATSVREGRKAIKQHEFDVMLVDLNLGDGEGFMLIDYMKSVRPTAEAIVISIMQNDEQVLHAFELGATGYLVKNSWFGSYPQAVLQVANGGASSAEIGNRLFISSLTVNTHIKNIYRKLQVRTRAQAVRFASLRGLF